MPTTPLQAARGRAEGRALVSFSLYFAGGFGAETPFSAASNKFGGLSLRPQEADSFCFKFRVASLGDMNDWAWEMGSQCSPAPTGQRGSRSLWSMSEGHGGHLISHESTGLADVPMSFRGNNYG